MISTTLCVFLLFFKICLTCETKSNPNVTICESLQELSSLHSLKSATLEVINLKAGKLFPINASTFQNVDSFENLNLNGVMDIIPQSFSQLNRLNNLELKDNNISVIRTKLFENPSVKKISVISCQVKDLQQGSFDNLPKIFSVSIVGNQISTIKTNVFSKTTINVLSLKNNKIQFIENAAFAEMKNLKTLKLNNNELTTFDTKLLLGGAPSLELLILSRNKIRSLTKDIFEGLKNLKSLYLNNNEIDALAEKCFHDLKSNELLDISNNNIKEISPKLFSKDGAKSLKKFYIHNNHLCFLSPKLFLRLSNIQDFSYGGNPWQCPCWELLDRWITSYNITRVCHEEFAAGQRPECIITEFAPGECVYDKERLNEVPNYFLTVTQAYEKVTGCSEEPE